MSPKILGSMQLLILITLLSACGGEEIDTTSPRISTVTESLNIPSIGQNVMAPAEWRTEVNASPATRFFGHHYYSPQSDPTDTFQETLVIGYYETIEYTSVESIKDDTFELTSTKNTSTADGHAVSVRTYNKEVNIGSSTYHIVIIEADFTFDKYTASVSAVGEAREQPSLESLVIQTVESMSIPDIADMEFAFKIGVENIVEFLNVNQVQHTSIEFAEDYQINFTRPKSWRHDVTIDNGIQIDSFDSPLSQPDDFADTLKIAQLSNEDYQNGIHDALLIKKGFDSSRLGGFPIKLPILNERGTISPDNSAESGIARINHLRLINADNRNSSTLSYRFLNEILLVNFTWEEENHFQISRVVDNFFTSFDMSIPRILTGESSWELQISRFSEFEINIRDETLWASDDENRRVVKIDINTGEILGTRTFDDHVKKISLNQLRNELVVHVTPNHRSSVTYRNGPGVILVLDTATLETKRTHQSDYIPREFDSGNEASTCVPIGPDRCT